MRSFFIAVSVLALLAGCGEHPTDPEPIDLCQEALTGTWARAHHGSHPDTMRVAAINRNDTQKMHRVIKRDAGREDIVMHGDFMVRTDALLSVGSSVISCRFHLETSLGDQIPSNVFHIWPNGTLQIFGLKFKQVKE